MKKVFSTIAVSAAILAGGALTAPSAQAASCHYLSCFHQNPTSMGCGADAYTIYNYSVNKQVRYSPICQAAWLRSNSGSHILGFGTDSVMRTYSGTANGYSILYSKGWLKMDSKISYMVPLAPSQFIQIEEKGNFNPTFTPMLNTVSVGP